MKNFKLNQDELISLTSNSLMLRNHFTFEMNKSQNEEVKNFYQKEIDNINKLFDILNVKFKTNF
jgi:hypothetical protein